MGESKKEGKKVPDQRSRRNVQKGRKSSNHAARNNNPQGKRKVKVSCCCYIYYYHSLFFWVREKADALLSRLVLGN